MRGNRSGKEMWLVFVFGAGFLVSFIKFCLVRTPCAFFGMSVSRRFRRACVFSVYRRSQGGFSLLLKGGERCCNGLWVSLPSRRVFFDLPAPQGSN